MMRPLNDDSLWDKVNSTLADKVIPTFTDSLRECRRLGSIVLRSASVFENQALVAKRPMYQCPTENAINRVG